MIGDTPQVKLNNDVTMPILGFGTYKIPPGPETRRAVEEALDVGYRHVDTASYYRNEREVGEAIRGSDVSREEVFVTTKVWNDEQGYHEARAAFERSLKRLNLDRIDLYLVHWPVPGKFAGTWKALEELYVEGMVRAIGVSNFMIHHLEDLLPRSSIVPAIDQIEFHPHLYNPDLLSYCRERRISPEAWSPLKRGEVVSMEVLNEIGGRHEKSAAQVTLRWAVQHGLSVIPRTVHRERMIENADIFDFELTQEEMERIDGLGVSERIGPDPDDSSRY